MSPSWRNQLRISLTPHQVTVQRRARGWRPQPAEQQQIACPAPLNNEPVWQPVLRSLEAVLNDQNVANSDAEVVVSNHFVRYVLLPVHAGMLRTSEDQALARHQFVQDYGPVAREWTVQVSDDGRGRGPRLASAIDTAFLQALRAIFKAKHLPLVSLQPYLMAMFNQWREQLKSASGLVLPEPGRICIARFSNGDWISIVNRRSGADWLQEFATLQARNLALGESEIPKDAPLRVYAPDFPPLRPEQQRLHPELSWLLADALPTASVAGQPLASTGS